MTAKERSIENELRTIRLLNFVALAVVLVIGTVFWLSARSTTDDIIATRTEARRAECFRDNDRSDKAVAKERKSAEVLIAAARRVPVEKFDTIALTDVERHYIDDQVAGAISIYPKRSCTPAAIKAYYEADR